ncbi:type II toxin-antitoxin system VapC family toxin [Microbacterium sp. NIBRBAC000506063]|uniref:type II toxin-antitoxin system VapC family toxin n=1 Tax=Microbacterium sp. NIBRBAC000506063 TaxID=2734618 RepID=UPI001BB5D844|nr:type II toxin-antitoxin system VapC family toxin [Microbacterium sp. NIBRBAC000506063]QTV80551.1 type II toxin-antitoxin system VapC family toxin [Microbacterium sp. NIBRBAC000506063]
MIVLDTNVVSESQRPRPESRVLDWMAAASGEGLHLTATVVSELAEGISRLPHGRRRAQLQDGLDLMLVEDFPDSILPFDTEAALAYGHILELRRTLGRPIEVADAQIAAVCLVHDATLATRNTDDFEGLGLALIDPWRE